MIEVKEEMERYRAYLSFDKTKRVTGLTPVGVVGELLLKLQDSPEWESILRRALWAAILARKPWRSDKTGWLIVLSIIAGLLLAIFTASPPDRVRMGIAYTGSVAAGLCAGKLGNLRNRRKW
jgi:hypothetical protein